jgi:hypothetical protein
MKNENETQIKKLMNESGKGYAFCSIAYYFNNRNYEEAYKFLKENKSLRTIAK